MCLSHPDHCPCTDINVNKFVYTYTSVYHSKVSTFTPMHVHEYIYIYMCICTYTKDMYFYICIRTKRCVHTYCLSKCLKCGAFAGWLGLRLCEFSWRSSWVLALSWLCKLCVCDVCVCSHMTLMLTPVWKSKDAVSWQRVHTRTRTCICIYRYTIMNAVSEGDDEIVLENQLRTHVGERNMHYLCLVAQRMCSTRLRHSPFLFQN